MAAKVLAEPRTVFSCSTCDMTRVRRKPLTIHVANGCPLDPETRACTTCSHRTIVDEERRKGCDLGLRNPLYAMLTHCESWEPKDTAVPHEHEWSDWKRALGAPTQARKCTTCSEIETRERDPIRA